MLQSAGTPLDGGVGGVGQGGKGKRRPSTQPCLDVANGGVTVLSPIDADVHPGRRSPDGAGYTADMARLKSDMAICMWLMRIITAEMAVLLFKVFVR
jgi:hypothetical protein